MFSAIQKSTGTCYTTTAAFLILALVFCPALIVLFRPIGDAGILGLVSVAAACLALAWLSWRRFSRLTMPTLGQ